MRRTLIYVIIFLFTGISSLSGQVLVTEFLADPQTPLESEWIELFNSSYYSVDLTGWQICDLVGCAEIGNIIIESDDFIILCQDKASFEMYYLPDNYDIYEISGWRALNNSGDEIILKNSDGIAADSIIYQEVNGDNISIERIASRYSRMGIVQLACFAGQQRFHTRTGQFCFGRIRG